MHIHIQYIFLLYNYHLRLCELVLRYIKMNVIVIINLQHLINYFNCRIDDIYPILYHMLEDYIYYLGLFRCTPRLNFHKILNLKYSILK